MSNRRLQQSITILISLSLVLLSACANIPSMQQRGDTEKQLASDHDWQVKQLNTATFDLITYQPIRFAKQTLLTICTWKI